MRGIWIQTLTTAECLSIAIHGGLTQLPCRASYPASSRISSKVPISAAVTRKRWTASSRALRASSGVDPALMTSSGIAWATNWFPSFQICAVYSILIVPAIFPSPKYPHIHRASRSRQVIKLPHESSEHPRSRLPLRSSVYHAGNDLELFVRQAKKAKCDPAGSIFFPATQCCKDASDSTCNV